MATIETYPVVIYPEVAQTSVKKPVRHLRLRLRKDLLISSLSVVAGLCIMLLMVLRILGPSMVTSFIAFALTLAGGIVWLMCAGEVA